jgi:hypothetical protein
VVEPWVSKFNLNMAVVGPYNRSSVDGREWLRIQTFKVIILRGTKMASRVDLEDQVDRSRHIKYVINNFFSTSYPI